MIQENILEIQGKIEKACKKSDRLTSEVRLIAVTKTQPTEAMAPLIALGIKAVGENKVQEIRDKYPVFQDAFHWHLIGHLQTNKIKYIIDKVSMIHSVDSYHLAEKINQEALKHQLVMPILIQVNIAEEDSKFGIAREACESVIREIASLPNVHIQGLMTIAPFVENPEENRWVFRTLKEIFIDIKNKTIDNVDMYELSMGMTNDFEVAIEEGATLVRIGTAIFGQRNYT